VALARSPKMHVHGADLASLQPHRTRKIEAVRARRYLLSASAKGRVKFRG